MTREEAIKWLDELKVKIDIPKAAISQCKKNEALEMAIQALLENDELSKDLDEALREIDEYEQGEKKALSQEPCDDAISRDAAIKALSHGEGCRNICANAIRRLPSVTQKSGKWRRVSIEKYIQHAMAYYECTICGEQILGEHNYCPNCGCRMFEPQESEE